MPGTQQEAASCSYKRSFLDNEEFLTPPVEVDDGQITHRRLPHILQTALVHLLLRSFRAIGSPGTRSLIPESPQPAESARSARQHLLTDHQSARDGIRFAKTVHGCNDSSRFHGGKAMVVKRIQAVGQAIVVVFSSLVAPVAVQMIVRDLNGEETTPARHEQPSSPKVEALPARVVSPGLMPVPATTQLPSPVAPTPPPPPALPLESLIQSVAQGTGRSPEEALQQAFRIALSRGLASQFDTGTWQRNGQAILDGALRNTSGIVRSWRALSASKEWKLVGSVFHAEVAMEIDRRVLLDRLRITSVPNNAIPNEGWRVSTSGTDRPHQ
jgi:hypothetical protein